MNTKNELIKVVKNLGGETDDEDNIESLIELISSQSDSRSDSRVEETLKDVLERLGVKKEEYEDKGMDDLRKLVRVQIPDTAGGNQGVRNDLIKLIEEMGGTTTDDETILSLISKAETAFENYVDLARQQATATAMYGLGKTLMELKIRGGMDRPAADMTEETIISLIENSNVNQLITMIGVQSEMNATDKAKDTLKDVLAELGAEESEYKDKNLKELIAHVEQQSKMNATDKAKDTLEDVLADLGVEESEYEGKNLEDLIAHVNTVINNDLKGILRDLDVDTATGYDKKTKEELVEEIKDKIVSINTNLEELKGILGDLGVDTATGYDEKTKEELVEEIKGKITKPYEQYYDDIKDLEVMAKAAPDNVYSENTSNDWHVNITASVSGAISRLEQSYNKTKNGDIDLSVDNSSVGMNGRQMAQYKSFIEDLENGVESRYPRNLKLRDFTVNPTTGPSNSLNNFSTTITKSYATTGSSDRETLEDALLTNLINNYGGLYNPGTNSDGWGQDDLARLAGINGYGELAKMIIAYNPTTDSQLSFYHSPHGTSTNTNYLGVDVLHMRAVSLFLYYYKDLGSETKIAADARRSEVHAAFNLSNAKNLTAVAMVNGDNNSMTLGIPRTGGTRNLDYKGTMMALRDSSTFMGDVTAVIKFVQPGSTNVGNFDGIDIRFENIGLTSDYLAGRNNDGTIKFEIGTNDLTNTDVDFEDSFDGRDINGSFYSRLTPAATTATWDNDYGDRNVMAGTFKARLEGENMRTAPLVGVFGASADY